MHIFIDMEYNLLTLAKLLREHTGRSLTTISKWSGVHNRLFSRLEAGAGCNSSTYERALSGLSEIWPVDLEWPRDIPRPPKPKEKAA
ncbi:hypothetical protein RHVG_00003 [Rhodovulum phage RS1]|uniref:hypothetical protein n=1 Tax=Rhodobacter phage RC1 TaxID=754055 RepID=UPI0002C184F5|nr:hypothetical protein RHWG_00053 [Rhodobacter phage RC1]YP_007676382.1 hypothetical protein RHVG_00003 [Rhodovulum phage RS1]AGH57968.1 hypothetical protein RHVG_00003 [Rhodovulum phage RS1]AGH58074.1 hypothetical protein RHWG_00053 [Rhodobacter phage RC1]